MRLSSAPLTPFRHLTPCGQGLGLRSFRLHYAHSAPKSPRLTGGPQNDSGVRSAHEPTGNLQDCPDHTARHIQTPNYRRTSRHLSRAISPSPSHRKQHPIPHSPPVTSTDSPIHNLSLQMSCISAKGSQQFPAVSSLMTAPLRSMPSYSRHLLNIIRPLIV